MVSHTEIAVAKANGHAGARKAHLRGGAKARKTAEKSITKRASKAAPSEPAGTDIVPVMKLRAIDIVDCEAPKSEDSTGELQKAAVDGIPDVLHMPGPAGAENGFPADPALVTDPELLELLQQLSETIDTANTVLDSAVTEPMNDGYAHRDETAAIGGERADVPAPPPETETPAPAEEDLPPLAAMSEAGANRPAQAGPKSRFGFGLFLNAALSGLILTAGAAWLVHTNPWLLERMGNTNKSTVTLAAPVEPAKDQASLAVPETPKVLASFTPPSADPVPMQAAQSAPARPEIEQSTGPVRTQAGKSVALNVALAPSAGSPETSVMVQGIPDDATLSKGKSLGSGNWLLSETQLENLELKAGKSLAPGMHVIEFIVVKSDGSVPETRKVNVLVDGPETASLAAAPAQASVIPVATVHGTTVAKRTQAGQTATPLPDSTSPPQTAQAALTPAEVKTLLARGTSLLDEGDVAGARLLLEYAAQRGSKEAMVKLAQSYDPDHLLKLAVHGVRPDARLSAQWYDRARVGSR